MSENSGQANELNEVIKTVNKGIELINSLSAKNKSDQRLNILLFNLQQFTEYIEDIELGY